MVSFGLAGSSGDTFDVVSPTGLHNSSSWMRQLVLIGTEVSIMPSALSHNSYSVNLIVSAAYESK